MNDKTAAVDPSTEVTSAPATDKTTIRPNLDNYVTAKSASGKRTHRIDDLTARTLDGKSLEEVVSGGKALGIDVGKWAHLNNGQQRMLIGNAIRKMLTATKEPLSEAALADVFGTPSAPYDAEKAAAAAQAAQAEKEKKAAEKAAAAEKKAADNAAKAEAKKAADAAKAEGANAGDAAVAGQKAKGKTKPAKPE